jgi:hypothetical protein
MTQNNPLPNMLYINDTCTSLFNINTQWEKRDAWADSKEDWLVECTVAAHYFGVETIVALVLITEEGVRFGRARVLNMLRDKHNPALHHHTLKCLAPLKLIPAKELTYRFMNTNDKQGRMPQLSVPYEHPTELSVGDRIKTDICPEGFKYDIQILNAFIATFNHNPGDSPHIHNMESFHLRNDGCTAGNSRAFIVWEQTHKNGASDVCITERHAFAEQMKEHKLFIYKEPDVEDMLKKVLSKGENLPDAVFVSSEAYESLKSTLKGAYTYSGWNPVKHYLSEPHLVYDGVPIHKVMVPGIQVWAGVNHEG